MGDRACADPASARSEPDGIPRRHRKRAGQLRPPDALDRPARRRVLEDAVIRPYRLARHCERSEAIHFAAKTVWIASSRSLSSGAHSRNPLASLDPIELLGRERRKRMEWEAPDA